MAAQKAEYDKWRSTARDEILKSIRISLNPVVIDKTWFGVTDPLNLEGPDKSATKWKVIGLNSLYAPEGCLVNIDSACSYAAPGGHYESPQYATDKSITQFQFILANSYATSDLINAYIKEKAIKLENYGNWADRSEMLRVSCIQLPGQHPYSTIWCRMVNVNYGSYTGVPQDISKFGGGASLKVRTAEVYPNIKFSQ